jgi:hypothetical protein
VHGFPPRASKADAKPRAKAENSDIDPKGFSLGGLAPQAVEHSAMSLIY